MKIHMVHVDTLSCEAIFRIAPNGDYIIISQCGGETEPNIRNRVRVFRSTDGGISWKDEGLIVKENGRAIYLTEVYVDEKEGAIYVYVVVHDGGFLDWDCRIIKSMDNGKSWTDGGANPWFSSFVFMRGTISRQNGDRLIPYQNYDVSEEEVCKLKEENKTLLSADIPYVDSGVIVIGKDGREQKSEPVRISMRQCGAVWQWPEPTVAELSDGRLVMLLRVNGAGVLYRSESVDGGLHWSEAVPTDIKNPGNKPKLLRHPDGRIILINTPCGRGGMKNRFPLEVWVSEDDMKTWRVRKTVSDYPGFYSYPDGVISPDGKKLLFSYEYNRHDIFFVECEL